MSIGSSILGCTGRTLARWSGSSIRVELRPELIRALRQAEAAAKAAGPLLGRADSAGHIRRLASRNTPIDGSPPFR
jgi:hypothetical protein